MARSYRFCCITVVVTAAALALAAVAGYLFLIWLIVTLFGEVFSEVDDALRLGVFQQFLSLSACPCKHLCPSDELRGPRKAEALGLDSMSRRNPKDQSRGLNN